jgi:hypothetical protein
MLGHHAVFGAASGTEQQRFLHAHDADARPVHELRLVVTQHGSRR